MVRIFIRMFRIPFERLEVGFEGFESLLKDSNLHSNALNAFRVVGILFRNFRIRFELFEFGFENF